jgi:hypothetical protein
MPKKAAKPEPADQAPLPDLDNLPPSPVSHDALHRIVNMYVGGTGMKATAEKLKLPYPYVQAVIRHYFPE